MATARGVRLAGVGAPRALKPCTRAAPAAVRGPRPARAVEVDSDTITLVLAAAAGVGFGIGMPVLFTVAEKRDRERIEEIREMNRATLKATGETMSEVRAARRPRAHRCLPLVQRLPGAGTAGAVRSPATTGARDASAR